MTTFANGELLFGMWPDDVVLQALVEKPMRQAFN